MDNGLPYTFLIKKLKLSRANMAEFSTKTDLFQALMSNQHQPRDNIIFFFLWQNNQIEQFKLGFVP